VTYTDATTDFFVTGISRIGSKKGVKRTITWCGFIAEFFLFCENH